MLIILEGGPFDGFAVEPTREGVAVPDSLGFSRRGESVVIAGGAGRPGMFTDWRIRDSVPPAALERQPESYTAHYHQTVRTTDDGAIVFEFYHPPEDDAR